MHLSVMHLSVVQNIKEQYRRILPLFHFLTPSIPIFISPFNLWIGFHSFYIAFLNLCCFKLSWNVIYMSFKCGNVGQMLKYFKKRNDLQHLSWEILPTLKDSSTKHFLCSFELFITTKEQSLCKKLHTDVHCCHCSALARCFLSFLFLMFVSVL